MVLKYLGYQGINGVLAMNFAIGKRIWPTVKTSVLFISAISLILPVASLYPIYTSMKLMLYVILYPASVYFIGCYAIGFIKRMIIKPTIKTGLKWLVRLSQAVLIIVCLGAACMNIYFSPYKKIYSCPYDSRKLVVFESLWIDSTYTAYPVRGLVFYQEQENGSVSTHDSSGFVQVHWDSAEQARVYIKPQAYYGEFSNRNGEIIVTY